MKIDLTREQEPTHLTCES